MTLYFDEDVRPDDQTAATLEATAVAALEGEGIDPECASISVSFVDRKEIRRLNREYRGVDRETDVLSFPAFEGGAIPDESQLTEDEELALGDVVICEDVCRAQAKEFGHGEEREIVYLFVHSVMHLLGYDHETEDEKQDMRAREEAVMELLGISR